MRSSVDGSAISSASSREEEKENVDHPDEVSVSNASDMNTE